MSIQVDNIEKIEEREEREKIEEREEREKIEKMSLFCWEKLSVVFEIEECGL